MYLVGAVVSRRSGVKQAVPYRTGREARYLSVSTKKKKKKAAIDDALAA